MRQKLQYDRMLQAFVGFFQGIWSNLRLWLYMSRLWDFDLYAAVHAVDSSMRTRRVKPTDVTDPEYFHKVVDCQYACPAHTPVPAYIRLIAQERYTDAYLINWESNVFPGVLGRTCDRPCEPACRRGRVEEEPVAICRLKRVAADFKEEVAGFLPKAGKPNGKKIALIGAGPASLTVARDLAPLGYELHLYDEQVKGGGFMRSQIPSFRLPESVLDEEIGYVLDMGVTTILTPMSTAWPRC